MNPLAYKLAEEFKKALVDDQIYSAINVTNYESLYLSKFFFSLTRTFFFNNFIRFEPQSSITFISGYIGPYFHESYDNFHSSNFPYGI